MLSPSGRPIAVAVFVGLSLLAASSCSSGDSSHRSESSSAVSTQASVPVGPTDGSPTVGATTSSSIAAPSSGPTAVLPNLCAGADQPEDAADAYMGALSAGQTSRAQACVQSGTVPDSVTLSLSTPTARTAVYLPDPSGSSGNTFAFEGAGKHVKVTVSAQPGGTYLVTAVTVS
jgi:hypothetical protein